MLLGVQPLHAHAISHIEETAVDSARDPNTLEIEKKSLDSDTLAKTTLEQILSSISGDSQDQLPDLGTVDPFPVDPDAPNEGQQFTLRAVLVGCALGAIISASKLVCLI